MQLNILHLLIRCYDVIKMCYDWYIVFRDYNYSNINGNNSLV